MNRFLNWLLGRNEDVAEEETNTYLNQELHTCDRFGKAVQQQLQELHPNQRQLAERLIPALMELGNSSHPPQDLSLFFELTNWPRHEQEFRLLMAAWWKILQHCNSQDYSSSSDNSCCPINQHNLPAARAIIWLQIHLLGAGVVSDLLSFMDECVQQYPHCSEISEQLALSAANALARTPFYRRHQFEIAMTHPALTRGRLGRILQAQPMKWAS